MAGILDRLVARGMVLAMVERAGIILGIVFEPAHATAPIR